MQARYGFQVPNATRRSAEGVGVLLEDGLGCIEGGLLGAFDQVNPGVDDFDVDLLNPVSITVPRHIDRSIAQRFQGSASASGQSDDGHSF